MLERLVGLDKMTLHQCESLAKDVGFDGATFEFCGPLGCKKAKWVDAYFGLFEIEGQEGVLMTKQLEFAQGLWCQNLMPPNKDSPDSR